MRLLHTNDWHAWHLTPRSRLDAWPETLFKKLDQIAEIARLERVQGIAIAGDIFHSVHTTFTLVNRLIEWGLAQRADGIGLYAIAGNHDERYNRLDSVPTTPIGTLFQSGVFTNVAHRAVAVEVPYLQGLVTGLPWPDAQHLANWTALAQSLQFDGAVVPIVALGHTFASKAGGQFFKSPVVSYAALSALPMQVFHFGHDHSAQGTEKINGKLFLNFGALARGSLAAEELTRDIKVAITESTTTGVEGHFVKLRVEPSAAIFDLGRYAFEKDLSEQFESGLGQDIAADFLALADSRSLPDRVEDLSVDADVKARVRQYLTAAEEATP